MKYPVAGAPQALAPRNEWHHLKKHQKKSPRDSDTPQERKSVQMQGIEMKEMSLLCCDPVAIL